MTVQTQSLFPWRLSEPDAENLSSVLGVSTNKIKIRETLSDQEAPTCGCCGRQIGLLDVASTAIDKSVHGSDFLRVFFSGGNMAEVATAAQLKRVLKVEHEVSCFACGKIQETRNKWTPFHW